MFSQLGEKSELKILRDAKVMKISYIAGATVELVPRVRLILIADSV